LKGRVVFRCRKKRVLGPSWSELCSWMELWHQVRRSCYKGKEAFQVPGWGVCLLAYGEKPSVILNMFNVILLDFFFLIKHAEKPRLLNSCTEMM
jgi:hypothetical protein